MNKEAAKRTITTKNTLVLVFSVAFVIFLLIFRLGSLSKGLALGEIRMSQVAVGWHGIYRSPLYFPLKLIESIDYKLFRHHGQTLTRLPETLFGLLSIGCFSGTAYLWHGKRTAILAGALFACSAWTLHVSRLASYDILYLFGMTAILFVHQLLYKYDGKLSIWFINLFLWGLLLTIPGFIWLVLVDAIFQRDVIAEGWREFSKWWMRGLSLILPIIFLPLLGVDFARHGELIRWLGLPSRFVGFSKLLRQFTAVFFHLFIRGPLYPALWLGRAPVLDLFSLATCLLGIYFYAAHYKSSRSRLLGLLFLISVILVTINGAVSFSLLMPLAYIMAAMGISYLLHKWLVVFPKNPLARSFGVAIISVAVLISCIYNLRAYFVAWPKDPSTVSTFSHRL